MAKRKPKGPKLLASWLKTNEMSLLGFSEIVDCSKQTVGGIKQGTFSPGLALAVRIERETKGAVPAASWVE